jgi:hypothetical protein
MSAERQKPGDVASASRAAASTQGGTGTDVENPSGRGAPAEAPLPAEAQRDLAELKSDFGLYSFHVFRCEGEPVWAAIHRDATDYDAHFEAPSAGELRLSLELDRLRGSHPGYLIEWRHFADGMRFDARSLDETSPRLVVETAEELDEAIAAVEAGTWTP